MTKRKILLCLFLIVGSSMISPSFAHTLYGSPYHNCTAHGVTDDCEAGDDTDSPSQPAASEPSPPTDNSSPPDPDPDETDEPGLFQ